MSSKANPAFLTLDDIARFPMNLYWLDTLYWGFKWSFNDKNGYAAVGSEALKIFSLDSDFFLQIHKETKTSVNVQLHRRVKEIKPDDGFFLFFSFSVIGLRERPEHAVMKSSEDSVSVFFKVDPARVPGNFQWTVKCCCKMCETFYVENDDFRTQNELMMKDTGKMDEKAKRNFACLSAMMKCQNLDNFVSGRQPFGFASVKAALLNRSMEYATQIAFILCNRSDEKIYSRCGVAARILGYIHKGKKCSIDDDGLVLLFSMAYHYGLRYLQLLCRNYMERNLHGIDNIVNGLCLCEVLFLDNTLLDKLRTLFHGSEKEITSHKKWKSLKISVSNGIMDTIQRKSGEPPMDEKAENMKEVLEITSCMRISEETVYVPMELDEESSERTESGKKPGKKSQKKNRRKKK